MRIVVAPNAFKESLSAMRAARALERGLRRALPDAEIVAVPMADGGDGTVETLLAVRGGEMREVRVCDPLGRLVTASYAALGDGGTAVIEIASASGLRLLCPDERDPMRTSTRGTGELIRHAFEHGARRLTVGVGGSATVDGGVGVAAALGWRFLDARGHEVEPCGGCLEEIVALDDSNYRRWVKDRGEGIEIDVACDVANPLLGCDGAARVYGPQKGATPGQVERLEAGLRNLSDVIRGETGVVVADLAGAGAAGGLAAGLVAFCGATLRPGGEVIAESVGLGEALRGAKWAITGEGRLDGQTAFGKAPIVVARLARERGVPVIGVGGSVAEAADVLYNQGFSALFSICDGPMELADAMSCAEFLLEKMGRAIGGMIALSSISQ